MAKKKFGRGTVEINDKDRYAYKFVKCAYSKKDSYNYYLTKDLKVNNSHNHMSQVYAVIRLIVPEGAIVVTPFSQVFNTYMYECIKRRTDKLFFDRVISYFYFDDDEFLFNSIDRYVKLYSKDINKLLKKYNLNKNQIKYYNAYDYVQNRIDYKPNIILKPFEKLDCNVLTECASGLHFFFDMKGLNKYILTLRR